MARPRPEPDPRAAAVALRTLEGRPDRSGRWLVVDERTGDVARALTERGAEVHTWFRYQGPWGDASTAPPEGPFDQAVLRVPRARPAARLALEEIAAVLEPGGALWVTGCNDEGIKATGKHLEPWFDEAETLDTKFHARLWWARRTDAPARAGLEPHLEDVRLALPGGAITLARAPGVFAQGTLDGASELLLRALPELDLEVRRALDVGAGIGVLTAGLRQRWPEAELVALDHDAVSIAAIHRALPGVTALVSDALRGLPATESDFDLVVSNPPIHGTSNAIDTRMLEVVVEGAAERLRSGGQLLLVVQRQRPVQRTLESHLRDVTIVADDGRFRVWRATHA